MSVFIERISNNPIDSNSFVIYTHTNNSCVIVDPGSENSGDLLNFINARKLVPDYIFLTHEHFDHIWGVNLLKDIYKLQIVCSLACAKKIVDKKKNMSVFYNQVGFETYPADYIVKDNSTLDWLQYKFLFIETPGHTDGSMCISLNDNLFTGDTIIKNRKTVIKLPGGSKEKLLKSLDKIFSFSSGNKVNVYPGHGETFLLEECSSNNFI